MELEFNEEEDHYYVIIPATMINRLDWDVGDMLDYDTDDEILRIFKV